MYKNQHIGPWLMVGFLNEVGESYSKTVALNQCERAVINFGYSWDTFKERNRKRELIDLRSCVCKHLTTNGWTVTRAAELLSLHHASIIHHRKKFDDLIEYDYEFRKMYQKFITS